MLKFETWTWWTAKPSSAKIIVFSPNAILPYSHTVKLDGNERKRETNGVAGEVEHVKKAIICVLEHSIIGTPISIS